TDELVGYTHGEVEEATAALVGVANERGGADNITALTVRIDLDVLDPAGDAAHSREFGTKIRAFRSLPLFHRLQYGELIRVLSTTDVTDMKAGEVVLREGDEGDTMYVVISGRIGLDR